MEQSAPQEVLATGSGAFADPTGLKDSAWPIVRASLLGFFVGVLPGSGGIITTFMSYTLEKKLSRHPEKFGTGLIEGVAAPETANNAPPAGPWCPSFPWGSPPTPAWRCSSGPS
jgi:putative tricarboxylic transport membrane protein